MQPWVIVIIRSGNGLVPNGTKPLPQAILTDQQVYTQEHQIVINYVQNSNIFIQGDIFENAICKMSTSMSGLNVSTVLVLKWAYSTDRFNTMVADALVPSNHQIISRHGSDHAECCVLVFHQEGFQLPVSSQCWEITENTNIYFFGFLTIFQHDKG